MLPLHFLILSFLLPCEGCVGRKLTRSEIARAQLLGETDQIPDSSTHVFVLQLLLTTTLCCVEKPRLCLDEQEAKEKSTKEKERGSHENRQARLL